MSASLQAYLKQLPQGLESYPQFKLKGSVFRQFMDGIDAKALLPHLPSPLHTWVHEPPGDNGWIPEVHSWAVLAVSVDVVFDSLDAFQAYAYEVNHKAMGRPLYRALMAFISPERAVRVAGKTWSYIHAGSTLEVQELDGKRLELIIRHPRMAYPQFMLEALGGGFLAVARLAGEPETTVRYIRGAPEETHYELDWHGQKGAKTDGDGAFS